MYNRHLQRASNSESTVRLHDKRNEAGLQPTRVYQRKNFNNNNYSCNNNEMLLRWIHVNTILPTFGFFGLCNICTEN